MKRTWKSLWILVVTIYAVFSVFAYHWIAQPSTYEFTVEDMELSDDMAIRLTKRALEQDGKTPMRPMSSDRSEVFQRSTTHPNSGSVRWYAKDGSNIWNYGVVIEKRESRVVCSIHREL